MKWTIPPINETDHPLAFYNQMVEVYITDEVIFVDRCNIVDIAYVLPISEVECGMF
jgi:hypothetical protein